MKIDVRKKVLNLAVASAVGAAGLASLPAHAVNVSQNNVGEVLLFPLYTVRGGLDTVFTVTNTTARAVVMKVRWREALNSREVRDFNVVLSPYDVWTAGVTKDAAGTGALVRTYDNTCTSPALPASTTATGAKEIAFTSIGYDGTDASYPTDKGGTSITRVQEGYFEVFNMGELASGTIFTASKHGASGVPANCTTVANSVASDYPVGTLTQPTNALKGAVSYIDVATGKAIDATPTAIENFASTAIWAAPGDLNPDLADGDAGMTANFLDNGAAVAVAGIAQSQDAVSVLLMADNIMNEFASNGTTSLTDWVITFPTKHHYVDGTGNAQYPFGDNFPNDGTSCNTITPTLFNREEGSVAPSGNSFSPAPTGATAQLCYETNFISFNGANIFGTGVNHMSLDTTAVGTAGWLNLGLAGVVGAASATGVGGATTAAPRVTGFAGDSGLPVIGFAAVMRVAGSSSTNYGSTVNHAYRRAP